MTRLITFATDNMTIAAEICRESALSNNVQEAKIYGMGDIDAEFKNANKEIFASKRGPAYWIWKPYLIDRELRQMNEGDILIYSDAGVEFVNNVNHIIDRMGPYIFLFGNMWNHIHWCKSDVIYRINLGYIDPFNGDNTNKIKKLYRDHKQIQASVIFIRNNSFSRSIIEKWLQWCCVPGLIDDSPQNFYLDNEFQEHRHDQAILTCVAIDMHIPLHWWPAMYNGGIFTYEKTGYTDDYPILFHHHRMRNHQFSSADDLDRHMQNYFKRKYRLVA